MRKMTQFKWCFIEGLMNLFCSRVSFLLRVILIDNSCWFFWSQLNRAHLVPVLVQGAQFCTGKTLLLDWNDHWEELRKRSIPKYLESADWEKSIRLLRVVQKSILHAHKMDHLWSDKPQLRCCGLSDLRGLQIQSCHCTRSWEDLCFE